MKLRVGLSFDRGVNDGPELAFSIKLRDGLSLDNGDITGEPTTVEQSDNAVSSGGASDTLRLVLNGDTRLVLTLKLRDGLSLDGGGVENGPRLVVTLKLRGSLSLENGDITGEPTAVEQSDNVVSSGGACNTLRLVLSVDGGGVGSMFAIIYNLSGIARVIFWACT